MEEEVPENLPLPSAQLSQMLAFYVFHFLFYFVGFNFHAGMSVAIWFCFYLYIVQVGVSNFAIIFRPRLLSVIYMYIFTVLFNYVSYTCPFFYFFSYLSHN